MKKQSKKRVTIEVTDEDAKNQIIGMSQSRSSSTRNSEALAESNLLSLRDSELERSTAVPGELTKFGQIFLNDDASSAGSDSSVGEDEKEEDANKVNLKGFTKLME